MRQAIVVSESRCILDYGSADVVCVDENTTLVRLPKRLRIVPYRNGLGFTIRAVKNVSYPDYFRPIRIYDETI